MQSALQSLPEGSALRGKGPLTGHLGGRACDVGVWALPQAPASKPLSRVVRLCVSTGSGLSPGGLRVTSSVVWSP